MRKSSFAALALIGSVALVGAAVTPAMADDEPTPKTATIEIVGGALSITSGSSFALLGTAGAAAAPGTTVSGIAAGITVTDDRAGTTGWTSSVSMADFTAGTGVATEISVEGAGFYTPGTATQTANLGTSSVAVGTVQFGTTGGAFVQQTATNVSGNNESTWSADLSVPIPANTLAGTYTSTITHSVTTA
ncbi:hypothetical protein [Cryobacterium sp. N21]|uniref:hypothetical protein n=1 Tax=Cryobacterium sp. N21 TaxID=2048289 RepID=UPI000CE48742|nr:hypothetical protein [Cryobacterium sp. N21]